MMTKTDLTKEQIVELIEAEYIKFGVLADETDGKDKYFTTCWEVLGSILYRIEHGEIKDGN